MYLKVFVTAPLSHLLLMTKFTNTMCYKAGMRYTAVVRTAKLKGLHLEFKNTTQYTQKSSDCQLIVEENPLICTSYTITHLR